MERSKIKFLLIAIILIYSEISSQGLYVDYNHPVYNFLESMEVVGIIQNFHNQTRPMLRSKVTNYLSQIFDRRFELSSFDRELLEYFINEFYFDITGKLDKYDILFSSKKYDISSQREKFIFAYSEADNFSAFVKSHFNFSSLMSKIQNPAQYAVIGGRVYGSFHNKLGFEIDGMNGLVFGSKNLALQLNELTYNFKLNERPENRFFDISYGYLLVEFSHINFGIGKNRRTIGYGINKLILSDFSPSFEKIEFNLNYKNFTFDFLHGWLQDTSSRAENNSQRYFVHHRLAFSPFKNFYLGIGEAVIYARTSPVLSYLNPFNFYKSVEHQLNDRDNTLLYFDFSFIPIKSMRVYSTFLIDDIDFAKVGKKWFGNKTATNFGIKLYHELFDKPVDLTFEFTRIEPYTYTHRIETNKYVNFNYPLGTEQPPNSYRIDLQINCDFTPRFNVLAHYYFTKWGKNYYANGELINVGGDIHIGKRDQDSDYVTFLAGEIEKIDNFNLMITYELVKNIKLNSSLFFTKFSSGSSSLILTIGLISFL